MTQSGRYPARRGHPLLLALAISLSALMVLGGLGSAAGIAIHERLTTAPRAYQIFEMPYTKGVRSAEFREVIHAQGSTWSQSGVIEFAPQHAFSESEAGDDGIVYERDLVAGGVTYTQFLSSAKYRADGWEDLDFSELGWDGSPPSDLQVSGQATLDGQRAWVVKDVITSDKWLVAERTGDPLQAVIGGNDTYTFSHWGHAPAIQAPPAAQVSTARYRGSGTAPVIAPEATVRVLKAQPDPGDGLGDPAGFRTVALEISYKNNAAAVSDFLNMPSLVSPDGMVASPGLTTLSPALGTAGKVGRGQTITGWDAFTVPRQATSFRLLLGDSTTNQDNLDFLISISVTIPE